VTDWPTTDAARPDWLRRRERGSILSIKFSVRLAIILGRPVARLFLPFVCLYFVVFATGARRASRAYLARVLDRRPTWRDVFRHYGTFAACVLDRIFFLKQRTELFDIKTFGEALLTDLLAENTGCFLLGAHIGSFEVLRALGRKQPNLRVNMLMFEENAKKISSVLSAIAPDLAKEIIHLGRPDAFIKTLRSLEKGHFVGLLADRSLHNDSQLLLPFLGSPARFSGSAFRMMALLQKPVVLMVGLYRGGNRYDIHIEMFAGPGELSRRASPAEIEALVGRYVARLEHYCRTAPYNWFNFYNFWE
jgi:predicted LPLAT superfamily acyltransferase